MVYRSTVGKAVVRVRLVSEGWCIGRPKSPGPKPPGAFFIAYP